VNGDESMLKTPSIRVQQNLEEGEIGITVVINNNITN
jgi:hypothetical protein